MRDELDIDTFRWKSICYTVKYHQITCHHYSVPTVFFGFVFVDSTWEDNVTEKSRINENKWHIFALLYAYTSIALSLFTSEITITFGLMLLLTLLKE